MARKPASKARKFQCTYVRGDSKRCHAFSKNEGRCSQHALCSESGCGDIQHQGKKCSKHMKKKFCNDPSGCKTPAIYGYDTCRNHEENLRQVENSSKARKFQCTYVRGDGEKCNAFLKDSGRCSRHALCSEPGCGDMQRQGKKCGKHMQKKICNDPSGCKTPAIYGYDTCTNHGAKQCQVENCKSGARGGSGRCSFHNGIPTCIFLGPGVCPTPGIGASRLCSLHGGGPRCKFLACGFGRRARSDYCIGHGGRTCLYKNGDICCTHGARLPDDYCVNHGGGPRCSISLCHRGARPLSLVCIGHGGGKKCPNCVDCIDVRVGSYKYDGFCATCFKRVFPEDPRSLKIIARGSKEMIVRNKINKYFHGFVHNKVLWISGCDCEHKRRIDHWKMIGNTILAIETDEFAHVGYNKADEQYIRYNDLQMIHGGKWMFIRFNPDANRSKLALEDKLNALIKTMFQCIERIEREDNTDFLEIIKLFY